MRSKKKPGAQAFARRRGVVARYGGRKAVAGEPGMVTSEFALVTPLYFLSFMVMVALLINGWMHVSVNNEAKEIAREVSLYGESVLAQQARESGAQVDITVEDQIVTVAVEREGTGVFDLLNIDFVGKHRSLVEPGVSNV